MESKNKLVLELIGVYNQQPSEKELFLYGAPEPSGKLILSFDVSDYSGNDELPTREERIASALYTGIQNPKFKEVYIAPFYADGYDFYAATKDGMRNGVIHHEEVKDLDHALIHKLFEEYSKGKATPCVLKDAYEFLKEPRNEILSEASYSSKDSVKLYREVDKETFKAFCNDVLSNPDDYERIYGRKTVEACKLIGNEEPFYRMNTTFNMIAFPTDFMPHCPDIKRTSSTYASVESEIGGCLFKSYHMIDSHSVSKFGPVSDIELIGMHLQFYIESVISDALDNFNEKRRSDFIYNINPEQIHFDGDCCRIDLNYVEYALSSGDIIGLVNRINKPEIIDCDIAGIGFSQSSSGCPHAESEIWIDYLPDSSKDDLETAYIPLSLDEQSILNNIVFDYYKNKTSTKSTEAARKDVEI